MLNKRDTRADPCQGQSMHYVIADRKTGQQIILQIPWPNPRCNTLLTFQPSNHLSLILYIDKLGNEYMGANVQKFIVRSNYNSSQASS